jgi:outer membrane biosynthesis protein TonB
VPKTTEEKEVDLTAYLNKPATDLQERFAEWLMDGDIVGYDPNSAKNKTEAFKEGVRLATAMRMVFQASPENKAANAERKAARGAEEEEAPAKPVKATAKGAPKKAAKRAPVVEEEPEEEEAPAPKKAAVKKKAPAKRRPATDEDEAPF